MTLVHYWEIKDDIDPDVWAAICADVTRLLDRSPVWLCRARDDIANRPHATADWVLLNGLDEPGADFCFYPEPAELMSCDTGGHPYDQVVCAVLAVIRDRCKAVLISSDATTAHWMDPCNWASAVLGRRIDNPVL